ncbi:MAG: hypothetical protein V3W18_01765 [candidate division Zixibacteria bacterium]
MKKITLLTMAVAIISNVATAQTTKLIFGPRDGDNAGVLEVYRNATFFLEVWMRTAPDTNIVYFHFPMSTNDLHIQGNSDAEIEFYYPLTIWDHNVYYPAQNDPVNEGYTVHSLRCTKDYPSFPEPDDGIDTDGEWWLIASYKIALTAETEGELLCDSFIEGFHPLVEELKLIAFPDYILDPSVYEVEFSCLTVIENECVQYSLGDYNGSGDFNVADVIASFSKLKTGNPDAALLCECPAGSGVDWAVAMDVNNNCIFNIADVIAAFSKLKTGSPELVPCEYCPPWDES